MTTINSTSLAFYTQSPLAVTPAPASQPDAVVSAQTTAAPTIGLKNSAVVSISASAQAVAAAASTVTLSTDDIVTQLADLTKQVKAGTLKTINVVAPSSQTSGDPVLSLTNKQFTAGADAWKALKGNFSIAITDSKAADALATATAADKVLSTVKSTITKSHIQIADTAANVVANIASLEKLAVKGQIDTITITDGKALSMKAADITKNADVFNVAFGGTSKTAIEATDVLAANITSLESSIEDNAKLTLTKVSVTDKTANVQAAISNLEAAVVAGNATNSSTPKISQIAVSDKGTLTLSNSSVSADLDALKLLSGAYTLKVTDISAADALKLKAPSKEATLTLAIKDTTTSVSANWDALQKQAAAKTLSSITLSDINASTLGISVKQLDSAKDALKLVTGTYKLAVTDALATDVATALKAKNLYSIAIKDNAANILSNMKVIGPAVTAAKIASVTLTDKKAPTLSIADAFTLTKTLPNYSMPTGMKLGIADTASTIIAHKRFDVGDILANAGAISLTDVTIPNLTLADATTLKSISLLSSKTKYAVIDGANTIVAQSKITGEKILSGASTVQINKIFSIADYKAASALKTWDKTTVYSIADTVDNVLALATNKADKILKGAKTVSIVDTAAHILAKLDNLQSIAKTGQIADITGSDALVNVTTLTDNKKISNAEAIGKILNIGDATDATAPTAPTLTGPSGTISNNNPTFSGTAEANSTVTIYDNGNTSIGTATASSTGSWTFTPTAALSDGAYTITAKATDAAGNVSGASNSISFILDATAPTAPTLTGPSGTISNNNPTFSGTAEANSTITLFNGNAQIGTATTNVSGNWTYTPSTALSDGSYSLTAKATDAVGNVSSNSANLTFTVKTSLSAADITNTSTQFYWDPKVGGNGHIYEFVSSSILWADAVTNSSSKNISGYSGYLVTITSQGEQNFIVSHYPSNMVMSWLGATYQTAGQWKWVTGPEAGQLFWSGGANGSAVNNAYNNWDLNPNPNYYGPQPDGGGGQNFLVLGGATSSYFYGVQTPYKWLDGPSISLGQMVSYIIEYGS